MALVSGFNTFSHFKRLMSWSSSCLIPQNILKSRLLCDIRSCTSVLLYPAIIFILTGRAHADEQYWISGERRGREVARLWAWRADTVMNIGGALHREELGVRRGTPEHNRNSTFWSRLGRVYTKQPTVHVNGHIYLYIQWVMKIVGACRHGASSNFTDRWWTKVAAVVMIKLVCFLHCLEEIKVVYTHTVGFI